MLNKVTKLPKSRFYVFGFDEKKQFVGRNATPNMGWLQSFSDSWGLIIFDFLKIGQDLDLRPCFTIIRH